MESLKSWDRIRRAGSWVGLILMLGSSVCFAADWPLHGLNHGETRFSPLNQIDTENVGTLGLAWSHEFESRRGIEATPIVVNGNLYVTRPWSVVSAFDAVSGQLLWEWDPKVNRAIWGRRACCDVVNRGVAYFEGRIYVGVLDGRLVALDADEGTPVWETVTFDQSKNYTITGAPRIVGNRVVIGNGGAEYGVRGHVSAYDSATGVMLWRTYTVPGNPEDGFESEAMEQAAETWNGEWWKAGGGGTCWDSMAYDPDLDLLYVGTGNGSPWNRRLRSPGGGDNLYLASILALNPEDGSLVWHYQTTPGDTWDFTATQHMILAELEIEGRPRSVLMQAPKNGFFYVIDRKTGEFISAENYTSVTWADGVDQETGRPREVPGADYAERSASIKPGPEGGHNWQPMAYSAKTGLVYIPVQEFHIALGDDPKWQYDSNVWNLGIRFRGGGVGDPPGSLVAWNPVTQQKAWEVPQSIVWNGGILATGGNLLFQGTGEGEFVAYDARNGYQLWKSFVGTGIIAPPITYSVDGIQYIAVAAGWGGSYGLKNQPGGEAAQYEQVGRLMVYRLDGEAPMPSFVRRPAPRYTGPEIEFDYTQEDVLAGRRLYGTYCGACHQNGVAIPSLVYTKKETHQLWELIVHDGLYAAAKGMPAFKGILTKEQVSQLQAFVVDYSRGLARNQQRNKN